MTRRRIFATLVFGAVCAAWPASAVAGDDPVTFTRDVAPIFFKHCVECHRPTMFAPMTLMSYEDARPWARSIKQRVSAKTMPPWGA
ncbi:MAG: thiol-disulfide isomerase, partial [Vicinamibacterales bacterium]